MCGQVETCSIHDNGSIACLKEECGLPPALPYSTTLGNIYTIGSKVCYQCQHGSKNVGGNIRCATCTETGNWSAVDIQCETLFVCDKYWILHAGHCYFECATELKWIDAQSYCRNVGGYLVSIETETENNFLADTFPSGGYWLGGNDIEQNGVFVWDSGSDFIFDNWDDGQPSDQLDKVDCMRSRGTGTWKWHDRDCGVPFKSICEKEARFKTDDGVASISTTTILTTSTLSVTHVTTTAQPINNIYACPTDWVQYLDHCYFQDWVDRSWIDAQSNCENQGGYMLSIETAVEYEFIKHGFYAGVSWLGGTDAALEGVWVWDSGADVMFTQWEPFQPDNVWEGDCMAVNVAWNTWQWDDQQCFIGYKSVCEMEL